MKANAPEKIYIHPDIGGREFLRPWLHRPANNESVEYVRTDAFIEKACEELKQLMYDSLMYQGRLERYAVIDNFIEDFKERIKRE